jgi:beta-ureidopropionase
MSKSSSSSQITSIESVLEQHIPRDQLAEVKRILYGNPVESLPIPDSANGVLHQFVWCPAEQMRSPRLVRIALVQNTVVKPTSAPIREQFEAIRDKVEHMIDAAAAAGANVVCFQEAWTMPFAFCTREKQPWLEFAEDASSGPSAEFCRRKAKQHRMVIVSPILERDEAHGDTIWNTAVVFGPAGNYVGKSRKNHIPRVGDFMCGCKMLRRDNRSRAKRRYECENARQFDLILSQPNCTSSPARAALSRSVCETLGSGVRGSVASEPVSRTTCGSKSGCT